jgi:Reverse transcriptase (RNA-dependent DNA polymerase)
VADLVDAQHEVMQVAWINETIPEGWTKGVSCPVYIDFKVAHDTIIRNEVYVSMSEHNFPTKLICLRMATLRTVLCCVKIQNDCSEYFETRQGLRQGDILSTLLFNAVLEVIVRRANMQASGTILTKHRQIFAYADDIDIIGKTQAAVREAYKEGSKQSITED